MAKSLKIKNIAKRNRAVDLSRFDEANRAIAELRSRGLQKRAYGLSSPYVRAIGPVEPRVKNDSDSQVSTGIATYLYIED